MCAANVSPQVFFCDRYLLPSESSSTVNFVQNVQLILIEKRLEQLCVHCQMKKSVWSGTSNRCLNCKNLEIWVEILRNRLINLYISSTNSGQLEHNRGGGWYHSVFIIQRHQTRGTRALANIRRMSLLLPLQWWALFPLGKMPGLTVKRHYEPVAMQFITVTTSKWRLCFQDLKRFMTFWALFKQWCTTKSDCLMQSHFEKWQILLAVCLAISSEH